MRELGVGARNEIARPASRAGVFRQSRFGYSKRPISIVSFAENAWSASKS